MLRTCTALLLVLSAGASALAQKTHDLSLALKPGRPVLVELKSAGSGRVKVTQGEKVVVDRPASGASSIVCVDVLGKEGPEGRSLRRKIVAWHDTQNGEVKDPSVTGAVARFTVPKGGPPEIALEDERLALKEELHKLLHQARGAGPWLPLPDAMKEGETRVIDFSALAPFLMDHDKEMKASGKMKLLAVEEGKPAVLEGTLTCEGTDEVAGVPTQMKAEGPAQLRVDLVERRIVGLTFEPKVTMKGASAVVTIDAVITGKTTLRARVGAVAEKALKRKARPRARRYKLQEFGLSLELPSLWYANGFAKKAHTFSTQAPPGKEGWGFEVMVFAAADTLKALEAIRGQILKQYPKAKLSETRSPAGSGFRYSIPVGDLVTHGAMIGARKRVVRLKLICPKGSASKARKDFNGVLKSLREAR